MAQRRGRRAHGPPRTASTIVAVAAVCMLAQLPASEIARADTVSNVNAEAANIAAEIAKLQPQVDQALADYDTALDAVGQTVSTSVAAERAYERLQAAADAAMVAQNSHAVALYESGGSVVLYAHVLEGSDPTNLRQVPMLSGIVAQDAAAAAVATRAARAAKRSAQLADDEISGAFTNADAVDQRLGQLQALLAQEQGLLDEASAKARQLQALQSAAAAVAAARAAAAQAGTEAAASVAPYPIPPTYRTLYQAAAHSCAGLSWTVLAAIGQVETRHGSGTMVSSAGALGPMQFLPATFRHHAVDGDHNGVADIMNPADSIFTAAQYLCANGAGEGDHGLYSALWNYNHADWYVRLVLALSAKIT